MGNWGIRNLGKKWEFWEKNGILGENGNFEIKWEFWKNWEFWGKWEFLGKWEFWEIMNVARFARNVVKMRLFGWFSNTVPQYNYNRCSIEKCIGLKKYSSSLYNKDSFNVGQLFSLSVLIQAGYLSKKRERKKKFGECCSATEVLYIVDGGLEQTPKQKKLDNMMEDEVFILVFFDDIQRFLKFKLRHFW